MKYIKFIGAKLTIVLFLVFGVSNLYALLPGDANCDGKVDGIDFVIWLNFYGKTPQTCPNDPDFNNDNKVDGIDYVSWLSNYGKTETPTPRPSSTPTLALTVTPVPTGTSVVVAAAGDIACGTADIGSGFPCKDKETAAAITSISPKAVFPLGDIQYESGTFSDFLNYYDHSWGVFKNITYPVLGNHEYGVSGAAGYFDYFNGVGNAAGKAGERGKGYYSFNLGSWHMIVLNANCTKVTGGCGVGSAQEQWLRNDLSVNAGKFCTLAMWHQPRYSSGHEGDGGLTYSAFWQALLDYHAEVVLSGHSHDYERFAPQDNTSHVLSTGIVQFIVGTGGRDFTGWLSILPNSLVRNNTTFGVLKLTLHPTSYDWKFLPIAGSTFTDSGSASCH